MRLNDLVGAVGKLPNFLLEPDLKICRQFAGKEYRSSQPRPQTGIEGLLKVKEGK
jgi:hypothetical protein